MDDRILEAFAFGKIQECLNIKLKLDEYNISWEEFTEWVKDKAKRVIPTPNQSIPEKPQQVLKRKCPACGQWLSLMEVNNHPTTMVGDGYKTLWWCRWCDWEEYSMNGVIQEITPYLEELTVVYVNDTPRDRRRRRRIADMEKCNGCEEK